MKRAGAPPRALTALQRGAGNRATARLLRVVTDNTGRPIPAAQARAALMAGVPATDMESQAIVDALIADSRPYTMQQARQAMPASRYTPPGARQTALGTASDYGFHPLGFASTEDFQLFVEKMYSSMPAADATIVFHGSSLTGQSFKDKGGGSRLFDVGRDSDFDVAIASASLFKAAADAGVKIRGDHSEPLEAAQIEALGLGKAHAQASFLARREVNFMLYETVEQARQHEGPALVAARGADYREGTAQLHGDV